MPILSDEAIAQWTALGHANRQKKKKLSTSSALLLSSDAARPPLKTKVKLDLNPKPMSRQQRRALERSK